MKNKVFKMAGLRRARMEGVCGNFHSDYITRRGWAFCPWCGMELVFAKKCEKCGRNFNSEASFSAHQHPELLGKCPLDSSHIVKIRVHRKTMFCTACLKEYPMDGPKLRGERLMEYLDGRSQWQSLAKRTTKQ